MSIYIQIRDCESGPVLTVTPKEAKEIIDSMVSNAIEGIDAESYTFSTVELTAREFDSLPEFNGF